MNQGLEFSEYYESLEALFLEVFRKRGDIDNLVVIKNSDVSAVAGELRVVFKPFEFFWGFLAAVRTCKGRRQVIKATEHENSPRVAGLVAVGSTMTLTQGRFYKQLGTDRNIPPICLIPPCGNFRE